MSYLILIFASLLGIWSAFFPAHIFQTKPTPTIIPKVGDISIKVNAPLPGQALQGYVSVQGETNVEGFSRSELTFAYQDNPTNTWFLIQSMDAPGKGELFRWDTTAITDGNYQLRLVVILKDGRQSTVIIPNLRVRNYSPIETSTPAAAQGIVDDTPQGTPSPTARIRRSTPTPMPANPLSISQHDIYKFFAQGALAALFIVIAVTFVNAAKKSKKIQ